jgi:hypothetical protein
VVNVGNAVLAKAYEDFFNGLDVEALVYEVGAGVLAAMVEAGVGAGVGYGNKKAVATLPVVRARDVGATVMGATVAATVGSGVGAGVGDGDGG